MIWSILNDSESDRQQMTKTEAIKSVKDSYGLTYNEDF